MIALDTNIVVYSFQSGAKAETARRLAVRAMEIGAILPLQAVCEFANACHRKQMFSQESLAAALSSLLLAYRIVPTRAEDTEAALSLAQRFKLSYFDALIVQVAARAGASVLLSEDMQDRLAIQGLTIVNPFDPDNHELVERAW